LRYDLTQYDIPKCSAPRSVFARIDVIQRVNPSPIHSREGLFYGFVIGLIPGIFLLRDRVATGEMNPIVAIAITLPEGFIVGLASACYG